MADQDDFTFEILSTPENGEAITPEVISGAGAGAKYNFGKNHKGKGRKPGAKNKATSGYSQFVRQHYGVDLIKRCCDLALTRGDAVGMYAMKLMLDRIWPRTQAIRIESTAAPQMDPATFMQTVLNQMAAGEIAPTDAAAAVSVARAAHDLVPAVAGGSLSVQGDPREELANRLVRMIEARDRIPNVSGSSEDQSAPAAAITATDAAGGTSGFTVAAPNVSSASPEQRLERLEAILAEIGEGDDDDDG